MKTLSNASIIAMVFAFGQSANAQVAPPKTPLSDANCNVAPVVVDNRTFGFDQPVPPTSLPVACTVDGTRSVVPVGGTVETLVPVFDLHGQVFGYNVYGSYKVDFSGNLHPDGVPVLATGAGHLLLDASTFFNAATSVNVVTSYSAALNGVFFSPADAANRNYFYFQNYGDFQTRVNGINVSLTGTPVTIDGRTYLVDISTPDPNAPINGNSVAIVGRYNSSDSHGALVFGRITGTSSLVQNAGVSPSPDVSRDGSINGGYWSPFSLQYATTSIETTRLDENGLTTPTVSVSQGIDMNGSRISDLGPGVAPGDAVNVAQLAAEISQRLAADSMLVNRVGILEESLATIDARLERIDNRVDASAAVATALGGTTFLPDMKFNLSANVATYGGAHAGAVQMGARVTRNVAINAGVASGFNKGGKTAARVGVTFGW